MRAKSLWTGTTADVLSRMLRSAQNFATGTFADGTSRGIDDG